MLEVQCSGTPYQVSTFLISVRHPDLKREDRSPTRQDRAEASKRKHRFL